MRRALLERQIDAALGRIPCDWVIRDVTYLDVFTASWRTGDVAIAGGAIVAVDPGLKARREVAGRGKWLVPGFIDAHVHVESSLMTPGDFETAVLPHGTTTAICDPHELTNVHGVEGLQYFLNWSEALHLDLRVMLSSCVPATHLETNGGGLVGANDLVRFQDHARVLGLAEMMNIPGVLNKDPGVMEKLERFSAGVMDGHAPLLRGPALSAYLTAGISSCHESTEAPEALEKMTKGMAVWIREGSVAKDLHALAPLLNVATSSSMGFCTDDRNPYDIMREGHIDYLVREAIAMGVPSEAVFRASSWSIARHYGLRRKGGIAPGYEADLVLLADRDTVAIERVWRGGVLLSELGDRKGVETHFPNSVRIRLPEESALRPPEGRVQVIGIRPGKLITDRLVEDSRARGVAQLTVLERYGHHHPPASGYVRGFGEKFRGAIGSSVGHDSHNLIVAGDKPAEIRVALKALAESGGGFVVVQGQNVIAHLPLPVGGLMSPAGGAAIKAKLDTLYDASKAVACELAEPFLQLAFLSLPVIPSLKLTDKGLVDVDRFQIVPVKV